MSIADGARELDEGALLLLLHGARVAEVLLPRAQPLRRAAAFHGRKWVARQEVFQDYI